MDFGMAMLGRKSDPGELGNLGGDFNCPGRPPRLLSSYMCIKLFFRLGS